jgi:predicted amidohydrolase YtcJ
LGSQALLRKALINGNILTMNPDLPRAEAVLILGNRICDVGSTGRIRDQLGPGAEVLDLAGRTVTPGFVDAHAHPLGYGLAQAGIWLDCSDVACVDDLVAKAEERARGTPKGGWIFGRGWPASRLERWPSRHDFDSRVPDHPLWLNDLSGHLYVLNTRGLSEARITPETPQPPNARIDRDASGDLTGIIRDCDPWDFAAMPPFFSPADIVAGLRAAMAKVASLGLTTSTQIGIAIPPGPYGVERVRPWLDFHRAGELKVRMRFQIEPYAMLQADGEYTYLEALARLGLTVGFGNDMVKLGPLKVISDGWQCSRTGLMLEPYRNDPGNVGLAYRQASDYEQLVRLAHEAGLAVAVHTDGDGSAERIIGVYERVLDGQPNTLRHRLEHARILTDAQVERVARLGLVVCAAPVGYSREPWYYQMMCDNVGQHRRHRLLRHKELMDRGCVVCGGSDCHPGIDRWMSPLSAIQFLTTCGPEAQRFTVEEALRVYTLNGAYAFFDEDKLGSIEPGKLADLVVLDRDPTAIPEDEIGDIAVELTMVDGRVVYER